MSVAAAPPAPGGGVKTNASSAIRRARRPHQSPWAWHPASWQQRTTSESVLCVPQRLEVWCRDCLTPRRPKRPDERPGRSGRLGPQVVRMTQCGWSTRRQSRHERPPASNWLGYRGDATGINLKWEVGQVGHSRARGRDRVAEGFPVPIAARSREIARHPQARRWSSTCRHRVRCGRRGALGLLDVRCPERAAGAAQSPRTRDELSRCSPQCTPGHAPVRGLRGNWPDSPATPRGPRLAPIDFYGSASTQRSCST